MLSSDNSYRRETGHGGDLQGGVEFHNHPLLLTGWSQ